MPTPIADDFADIARIQREIAAETERAKEIAAARDNVLAGDAELTPNEVLYITRGTRIDQPSEMYETLFVTAAPEVSAAQERAVRRYVSQTGIYDWVIAPHGLYD